MHRLSLQGLINGLQERQFSSRELTHHYLQRIQQYKELNSFINIDEEQALIAAGNADKLRTKGEAHPLAGIPLAHKDNFCTHFLPTTCASKMLANFQSPYQATMVEKLQKVGMVMLGKTNMDEFAMGSANENSYFGPVKNPWDYERVPGGSSGGSAAAVAAELVPFATGTDTGGSIRQPAAFCGISGIKPTYGLISRYGMVAFASSLDQAGPMAHSAEDLALILPAMAGFDAKDSTSSDRSIPDYIKSLAKPLKGLRIGLASCFLQKEVTEDIQIAVAEAVKIFTQAGAQIIAFDLQHYHLWVPCYYVISSAEASTNLARYDGIRYGYRTDHATSLGDLISRSRNEGFGLEVKRRILTGTHVLSSGYFDAYYLQALKIRRLIHNELQECFRTMDIILGPTTTSCAFKLGEKASNPIKNYVGDIFTVAANLAGLPALSLPGGFSQGLPIGIQLMANHFKEETLLNAAHQFQLRTDWHQARPFDNR